MLLSKKLRNCNFGRDVRGSISTKLTSLLFVRTKVCNFGKNSTKESNVNINIVHLFSKNGTTKRMKHRVQNLPTSNVGIDTSNSIVIYNQSAQTIKMGHVLKLDNLIVRQINGIKLILPKIHSKG